MHEQGPTLSEDEEAAEAFELINTLRARRKVANAEKKEELLREISLIREQMHKSQEP